MSQARASASPAPAATPFTAAITGLSHSVTARAHLPTHMLGSRRSATEVAGIPAGSFRSRPAQNPRPAPVSTTTRTVSSPAASRRAAGRATAKSEFTAFRRSGLLSVMVQTPLAVLVRRTGAVAVLVAGGVVADMGVELRGRFEDH